jgi:poly(3-hydroxybutyrate) depolymerase
MSGRRARNSFAASVAALVCVIAGSAAAHAADPLPALGAKLTETSVSGLSSGAYMAGQFHLAHADIVVGAGIVAGGPWGCASTMWSWFLFGPYAAAANARQALDGCMDDILGPPDAASLARRAERAAGRGDIAPLAAIRRQRVYLFTGGADETVRSSIVRAAAEFYRGLGLPATNIRLVERTEAGHAFLTEDGPLACGATRPPYVEDCDYDQAGEILTHLLGPLQPARAPTGQWRRFRQQPDAPSWANFAPEGSLYVPSDCATRGGCRVHVVFHGCRQNTEAVGTAFTHGSGFHRWADANRLILLFPEVTVSTLNPRGCWDWWGYAARDFLTRDAPQIKAVRRMLDRLAEGP